MLLSRFHAITRYLPCEVKSGHVNKMTSEELNESELGTQKYWDSRYKTETNNFQDHGDVGEIWFGEESMDRICRWIFKTSRITRDSKIIDLGCGNGLFLIELATNEYKNLVGVDYSEDAIMLAKKIAEKEGVQITYKVFNILTDNFDKFDVVHDKGTYDAISLTAEAKTNRQIYINKVNEMLATNGIFIITSCNWTQKELVAHFTTKFVISQVIPTPQFKFGGQVGNNVTSIIFNKLN